MVLTSREHDADSGRSRVATGAVFGLIAAAAFGFSLVALDEAANADPYWATLILRTAVVDRRPGRRARHAPPDPRAPLVLARARP